MRIRLRAEDPERELTRGQFKGLVRTAKVSPSTLCWDPELTNGEWWTADDLRLFHRYSPTVHPPGPHLAASWTKQEALNDRGSWLPYGAAEAYESYSHGTLIEDRYEMPHLERLAREPGVVGVSRFMILPSFGSERALTAVFRTQEISLETAVSTVSSVRASLSEAWDSAGRPYEWKRFDPRSVVRRATALPAAEASKTFMTWERLAALSTEAPSCESRLTLDGVGYRHKIVIDGHLLDAEWHNPREEEHPRQAELVSAYEQLLTSVGLDDFGIP